MINTDKSTNILSDRIINLVVHNYKLDILGRHGIIHWARVRYNGLLLAKYLNINTDIIEYFSILHDSKRETEKLDKNHGQRSANFISEIRDKYITLNDHDFKILYEACLGHNTTKFHENLTIQVCWDADRLDLLRAGIVPAPEYMNTQLAKDNDVIESANKRSVENFAPPILDHWQKLL